MKKFLFLASVAVLFAACSSETEEIEMSNSVTRYPVGYDCAAKHPNCPYAGTTTTEHWHCKYCDHIEFSDSQASWHAQDAHGHASNFHEHYE